jgi:hydrogenase maturation protease
MIAVIGCGNPNRRDDGAGPAVIRLLRGRAGASERVKLLDAGTDGMAVMFAARGCSSLVVVDASRSGAIAGALFEVPGAELERRHQPGLNLHDFRWEHALDAGRRLFGAAFPADVTVLLIEAESVAIGVELSPRVAAAVSRAASRIEELIARRLT